MKFYISLFVFLIPSLSFNAIKNNSELRIALLDDIDKKTKKPKIIAIKEEHKPLLLQSDTIHDLIECNQSNEPIGLFYITEKELEKNEKTSTILSLFNLEYIHKLKNKSQNKNKDIVPSCIVNKLTQQNVSPRRASHLANKLLYLNSHLAYQAVCFYMTKYLDNFREYLENPTYFKKKFPVSWDVALDVGKYIFENANTLKKNLIYYCAISPLQSKCKEGFSIDDICFSPNKKIFASIGSIDGYLRIHNIKTGDISSKVKIKKKPKELTRPGFTSIDFSPDGKQLISGSTDGFLRFHNPKRNIF